MAYTLEYNRTLGIVELVFSGSHTQAESRESAAKAIALGKEHGDAHALVDATETELSVSILDLLDLPDRHYVEHDMSRRIKVAVLPPKNPGAKEDAWFFENTCRNRGWQVSLFANREDAIEWLT